MTDTPTVVDLAKSTVEIAVRNPQFTYVRRPNEAGDGTICTYFHEGRPDCLLGYGLAATLGRACQEYVEEVPIAELLAWLLDQEWLTWAGVDLTDTAREELVTAFVATQAAHDRPANWGVAAMPLAQWVADWDWPVAKTIDGIIVTKGMRVWDYNLRQSTVTDRRPFIDNQCKAWFNTDHGQFDGSRMWVRHPTTGRTW